MVHNSHTHTRKIMIVNDISLVWNTINKKKKIIEFYKYRFSRYPLRRINNFKHFFFISISIWSKFYQNQSSSF